VCYSCTTRNRLEEKLDHLDRSLLEDSWPSAKAIMALDHPLEDLWLTSTVVLDKSIVEDLWPKAIMVTPEEVEDEAELAVKAPIKADIGVTAVTAWVISLETVGRIRLDKRTTPTVQVTPLPSRRTTHRQ
jgi:hypothetical protein